MRDFIHDFTRPIGDDDKHEGDTGQDWPELDMTLLQDHRVPAPPLPLDAFGNYWSGWIRDQAEAKSCAPDYVAAGLMAAAGTLIGNARWPCPWDGWSEPPVVWLAAVGNPSSGKSPGLNVLRDLLGKIEAEGNEGHKDRLFEWETACRTAKLKTEAWESESRTAIKKGTPPPDRPHDAEPPDRPARTRIATSDATVEKLARLIQENPKGLLVFRDELAGWVGSLDKYGGAGGDRPFFLESYGGQSYVVDRVKSDEPLFVPSLTAGIVGGIQPDRLQSMILSGDDDGLAARFLYLWPEPVAPKRPERVPPSGAKAKLSLLHRLNNRHEDAGERDLMPFTEPARAALQQWRVRISESEVNASGLYLSWLGKLPGMAVRLACILEHLRWSGDHEGEAAPHEVSDLSACWAIAFLQDYALPMAQRSLGEATMPQQERDAIALARWITSSNAVPEVFNARDIRRHHAPIGRDAARYDAAFDELEQAGWVRRISRNSGPGRKAKVYEVNPTLRRRAAA